jgi:3-oxosteroid 1-dehydrogenase
MRSDNKLRTSRRRFVKDVGGAALGAAAMSTLPAAGCARASATEWAATYDWVCVGSGTSGLAAAIFGHDQGFKTLVVEVAPKVGGTTSQGAGLLYVPMNHLMKAAGISDSRDEALRYLQYLSGGNYSAEHQQAFVDNVARAVEYLHAKADVRFRISEMIDFWAGMSEGGWRHKEDVPIGSKRQGRSLICEPFPAETLGEWRDKVRLDVFYHGLAEALEGQEHNPSLGRLTKGATLGPHIGHSGPLRDADTTALRLWRKRLGPRLDALLKKDEEFRVGGASLVAHLLRAVVGRGIEVRLETMGDRLIVENGRVTGVVVRHQGREENIQATRGVLLATGGGNGWRMAAGAGAEVRSAATMPALPGFTVPEEKWVSRANYEARMRHSMIVNRFGERFGNEVPYQGLAGDIFKYDSHGEHRWVNIPNYLIFDRQAIDKYSFAGRPPGETEGLDWVAQGKTLGDLADRLKLPAARLEAAVARFNRNARRSVDPDFHRPADTLGPIEKPPFYGVEAAGPDTDPLQAAISPVPDTHGQMIHYETRKPIPGLYGPYAGGSSSHLRKLVFGFGYTAGLGQANSITFDLLAAEHAAGATT